MKPVISLAMFGSREREIREEKGPVVFCFGGGGGGGNEIWGEDFNGYHQFCIFNFPSKSIKLLLYS